MTPVPAQHTVAAASMHGGGPGAADEQRRELEVELPRLMALAYSILRDPEEAADAVQDTAEVACRSWSSLREASRRASWLSTICVRQALRRARAARRRRLVPWVQPHEPAPELQTTDVDLEQALQRLSPRQRAVVALHYVYGFSLDEVAVVLGCRPGTARSHLNRALASLRDTLEVIPRGTDT